MRYSLGDPHVKLCVRFLCFFYFRLSTFSHCASEGSPSWRIILEYETCGEYSLSFLKGQRTQRIQPRQTDNRSDLLEVGGEVMMAMMASKVPHA